MTIIPDRKSFGVEFYSGVYLEESSNDMVKTFTINSKHYDTICNILNRDDSGYNLKSLEKLSQCCCYGGGYPQFEIKFPINKVTIYDLIADKYQKRFNVFSSIYNVEGKDVEFKKHDLLNGIDKIENDILVTFIHVLEHLTFNDIKNILIDVRGKITDGSKVLIYQPNPRKARDNNWFHFDKHLQHINFMTIKSFGLLLNEIGFDIEHEMEYSDDLLLIFKKK
jgi:hypothetical protein